MKVKFGMMLLVAGFAPFAEADVPAITDVVASQRYPWNGKVDVAYTITGNVADFAAQYAMVPSLSFFAVDNETGTTNAATSLSGDLSTTEGRHAVVWDMDADCVLLKSTNATVSVSCDAVVAAYCIVDLSSGANSQSYRVDYMSAPPEDGFNVDEFKTMKLVLRKIESGTFLMGGQYSVKLTKPFYMGIFEVTQKQYSLIQGSNPSKYKGDMRPVESVSYHFIRGDGKGANWPQSSAVDSTSFLGKLRARTSLNFDLPTEAMWEYACRAGTRSSYNNGGNAESDLKVLGRYSGNAANGHGGYTSNHTTVGSYQANAWGLYDMHGNVSERCRDWYKSSILDGLGNGIDPEGPDTGPLGRVVRGGNCYVAASYCTSSYREGKLPSNDEYSIGLRLSCPCPSNGRNICLGESNPVAIDICAGTRNANPVEHIRYSCSWAGDVRDAVSVVDINGNTWISSPTDGCMDWYPVSNGIYVLTHRIMSGNSQIGESLTTTFQVNRMGFLATQTTAIPVPYAWLKMCYPYIHDEFDVYEAVAHGKSANRLKVWECYVIGLDPNDADGDFRITSFPMKSTGTPDLGNVRFEPPMEKWNVRSAKPVLKGKPDLNGDDWKVLDVTDEQLHFFRMEIAL